MDVLVLRLDITIMICLYIGSKYNLIKTRFKCIVLRLLH